MNEELDFDCDPQLYNPNFPYAESSWVDEIEEFFGDEWAKEYLEEEPMCMYCNDEGYNCRYCTGERE